MPKICLEIGIKKMFNKFKKVKFYFFILNEFDDFSE